MNWKDLYQEKLLSVEEAAAKIKSHDRVWYPPCDGAPKDLIEALTKRYKELEDVTMLTGLILYPFEYLKPEYKGHLNHHTFFMGPFERKLLAQGNVEVTSYQFGQTDWVTDHRIKANVFIVDVSPPDEEGNMSFGVMGSFNGYAAAKKAERVIVQVNNKQPYVYGPKETAFINVKDVSYICEKDHDLAELPNPPVSELEKTIASHIIPYIENGSTIQIGIGGLGNAIGFFLENHKDLGVHTEMVVDSMVTLAEKGVLTGANKTLYPGEITCSFGIGSRKLYEFMGKNKALRAYPIYYIANESVIAQNNKFVSINNALMCDLTGQVCSESLGFDQFSATGGQLNFVRGSAMSPGGKSFLAFSSVAEKKDGSITSRISAALPPGAAVTTPRTDVQYVVTEYGVADLRNKSIEQRVKEMIKIAHPSFREQLLKEAKENRLFY